MRSGVFVRTDMWREGEYLDLWSVPHFLSGIALGLVLHFCAFEFRSAIIIGALLLIAYEMFEVIVKIEETRMNRVLDVIVGMSSLIPSLYLAPQYSFVTVASAFVGIVLFDVTLSFFGWRASQKAAVLEARVKAEFERERARLRMRRERIRSRWQHRKEKWRHRPRHTVPGRHDGETRQDLL